jgi:hypothetical protein
MMKLVSFFPNLRVARVIKGTNNTDATSVTMKSIGANCSAFSMRSEYLR